MPANSQSWKAIFDYCGINDHDFDAEPFPLSHEQIKEACKRSNDTATGKREVRILCSQTSREDRPDIFKEKGLFLLPVKNGYYKIIKGEGYIDIKDIEGEVKEYSAKLDFRLDTLKIGNSEMQYLDYAYAASLIRSFTGDDSLILTIRGRKRTSKIDFCVGNHLITAEGVQTEVDAGYEGRDKVVLIEAKNSIEKSKKNTIIRQLYYPYRQWQQHTEKEIIVLLFTKDGEGENVTYSLREYAFDRSNNKKTSDYNSIELVKEGKFRIID